MPGEVSEKEKDNRGLVQLERHRDRVNDNLA